MFDCLKWAGNPSGSLPIRAARSLVLSTAHQLTWFGAPFLLSHIQPLLIVSLLSGTFRCECMHAVSLHFLFDRW